VTDTFTTTLKLGSTGTEVQQLQRFLNTHGFIVATSGNGSPGHETTYYGLATASAISRFQMAHALQILTPNGLTQGTGNFGPATMKVVNGMN
jgi:peptidoglycan hydrolase-like protein with peptidoglycan-binding domain